SGVVLYTYPYADTTGWATVDTAGLSTWKPMYNDPADWENGAFSRNATGHPDYGWGKYNDVTHNLVGDSLFIIKLRDGSFKKFWIVKKLSAADIYSFRYANLDGSNENSVKQDLSGFTGEDFYGFSLVDNTPVSFEPPIAGWDLLFTKYMSVQPNGTPYLVTGVLCNKNAASEKFHPVPFVFSDFGAGIWDSTRSSVGWDWKVFDMNTFTYRIVDSTVYFIKGMNGDIHKLYFTGFAGSTTGVITFVKSRAAAAGVNDLAGNSTDIKVYPNPATDRIIINITGKTGEELSLILTDLSGRQLRADRPGRLADGPNVFSMDVTGVQPGVYFVTVLTAATKTVTKVIIVH
ncbi:MAG: T9SS type A sorting domain-containing protein, partial [Bacteroidota bacterium]